LEREEPRIERMLRLRVGSHMDVDDLRQIVLLELCRALPRYRGEGSLSSFVCGITVRVVRRAKRSWARAKRLQSLAGDERAMTADPEERSFAREGVRRLERALSRIAPNKRNAFLMWAVGGKEPQEIASL